MKTLRWLTVVLPVLFLIAVDLVRHAVWPQLLHPYPGFFIILGVVALGTFLFSRFVFDHIERIEGRLVERNRELSRVSERASRQAAELSALHQAGLALVSDLSTEAVLLRVVELARELVGARYGALSVVDEGGGIVRFITSGLSPEAIVRIGEPPRGRGLLAVPLHPGGPMLVDDIAADPRRVGFPPNHPPMQTLVGVPIAARNRRLGNLYLADKIEAGQVVPFTRNDADLLALFAAQAAAAMENARLHAEVQALAATAERERIARELHDSLAQALGYIRMRATSAHDALGRADPEAARQALAQIDEVAAEAFADVREAILGLRSSRVGAERDLAGALADYLERYRHQTGIDARLDLAPAVRGVRLAPAVEAQLLPIIQEALANVRKHARAASATVSLTVVNGPGGPLLRTVIADQGVGFDRARVEGGHYGLATMRERAESVGGRLMVESAPGQGTRVTVEMPLEAVAAGAAAGSGAVEGV